MKQEQGRDLVLVCGPELLAALMDRHLVDEYVLMIKPRLLGKGKSLFRDIGKNTNLKLKMVRTFESGTVLHHYEHGG